MAAAEGGPDVRRPAAAGSAGRLDAVLRAWTGLVDGLAALGTVMICVLMVIISSDVVARNVLGGSLPLVSELGALTLVMIVYLQLGTAIRHDRLARAELFYAGFRARHPRAGALAGALFDIVGAAAVGTMAWSTYHILGRDISSAEYIGVTGVLTFPVWPFRVFILTGLAVGSLQLALQTVAGLRAAFAGRGGAR